jgi:hypothetical protein
MLIQLLNMELRSIIGIVPNGSLTAKVWNSRPGSAEQFTAEVI